MGCLIARLILIKDNVSVFEIRLNERFIVTSDRLGNN